MAGDPGDGRERDPDDARELLRALATVRGAVLTLAREQSTLSQAQLAQLLAVVDSESAHAIAILRRAIAQASMTRGGADDALVRLVSPHDL